MYSAFTDGYNSKLGDSNPYIGAYTRLAWEVGAYYKRAHKPMPRCVERSGWEGANTPVLFVDGKRHYLSLDIHRHIIVCEITE